MSTRVVKPEFKSKPKGHVHFLIKETAEKMALSLYEDLMHDNKTYAEWKAKCPDLTPEALKERFVGLMWPRLIGDARATLARMLTMNIAESLKEQISNALIQDNSLRRGRINATQIH